MKALPPAALSSLAGALRSEGTVDSKGSFTLDREQARKKMQKFQLADPRRYVLELVQAAVLRGATNIEFAVDSDDMIMRFDGRPFVHAEFDDLYGSLFADGDDDDLRAVRQLALGLNAAQGMDPKYVRVESGTAFLELIPGKEDRLEQAKHARSGTRIHVRQRVRLGLIADFFGHLMGTLAEEVHIRERCVHTSPRVELDGDLVSHGLTIQDSVHQHTFSVPAEGTFGAVAWVPNREAIRGELRLVKDGVWIESAVMTDCGTAIVAVASSRGLRKDASQAKIVDDSARRGVVATVQAARWDLLADLIRSWGGDPARFDQRVREEVLNFADLEGLQESESLRFVGRHVGWPECRGSRPFVSLTDLVDQQTGSKRAGARIGHARSHYPELEVNGLPVVEVPETEFDALTRILGRRPRTRDSDLKRQQTRLVSKRWWQQRSMEPKLPQHERFLLRASISAEDGRYVGELGIGARFFELGGTDSPAQVWMIKGGNLLGRHELELGIPHLWVAIEAPFMPTDTWDDARRGPAFVEAIVHTLVALADPLAHLRARVRQPDHERIVRGLLKRWLVLVLDESRRSELWQSCGFPPDEFEACEDIAATILPDVGELLRSGSEPTARVQAFRHSPLFEDFDGARVSIAELVERYEERGSLNYLVRGVQRVEGIGRDVLFLGRGDRRIILALFGEEALRPWNEQLEAAKHEQAFRAQDPVDFRELEAELEADVRASGRDPTLWMEPIEDLRGARGIVCLLPRGMIEYRAEDFGVVVFALYQDQRPLVGRDVVELGVGPALALIDSARVTPNRTWDGAVDDAELAAVVDAVRRGLSRILDRACERFYGLPSVDRTHMLPILLHALENNVIKPEVGAGARWPQAARSLPLFRGVDNAQLSIADLWAIVSEHGKVQYVSDDEPWADLGEPAMVRASEQSLRLLRRLFDDKLTDGTARMQRRHIQDKLLLLPRLGQPKLEPSGMLVTVTLGGGEAVGEIGIPRTREGRGLNLVLGTMGHRVGAIQDPNLPVPLEAIVEDPGLPLMADASVDASARRVVRLVRRCRRSIPQLIKALTQAFEQLEGGERERARAHLIRFAADVLDDTQQDSRATMEAYRAVSGLPLLEDAFGVHHTIAEAEKTADSGTKIDVLTYRHRLLPGLTAADAAAGLGRIVYSVAGPDGATIRRLLERLGSVREVDDRWSLEIDAIRSTATAPRHQEPNLERDALVVRSAQVSGGLEAKLWILRADAERWISGDLADSRVQFLREERIATYATLLAMFPCSGCVRGLGYPIVGGVPELDTKQWVSLRRQVLILYETLLSRLDAKSNVRSEDRELILALASRIQAQLGAHAEDPVWRGLGKVRARVERALAKSVPPTIVRATTPAPTSGSDPLEALLGGLDIRATNEGEAALAGAMGLLFDGGGSGAGAELLAPEAPGNAADPFDGIAGSGSDGPGTRPSVSLDLPREHQRLVAALHEELRWAHQHHGGALGRFALDQLGFGNPTGSAVAGMGSQGLELRAQHPLVQRLLAQADREAGFDAIDLAFLAAAVFTVLNYDAEDIADDDERQYVAHLAEALVLARRTRAPP